jgi:hypothetical protein
MMNTNELYEKILNPKIRCQTREQIWHLYLKEHYSNSAFLEFGVWQGRSINYMALVRPDCFFHGFDSFEGLPEDWKESHSKGIFATDFSKLKFKSNVFIYKGWFEETISKVKNIKEPIKGIHIDCDIGSSTNTILNNLSQLIIEQKPMLLFDEMFNYRGYEEHEFKSFLNWINENNLDFNIEASNLNHEQVLIKLL